MNSARTKPLGELCESGVGADGGDGIVSLPEPIPMHVWAIILTVYAAMSVVTFVAFGLDKRAARLGQRRTPERTLHTLELLGGWPGAMLAMWLIRHKNRKGKYLAVFALIVVAHAGAWAAYIWLSH